MKKIIILLLLAAVLQSCSNEASYKLFWQDMSVWAGGGVATSQDSDPEDSFDSPAVGFQVGGETKIFELSSVSSIRGGLGFSSQGAGYKEPESPGIPAFSGKVKFSYLNVPLIYTYQSKKKFYGEIGLQPGFLLSAKDEYNGQSYDYKDYVNKFELGLPIGVGYRLNDRISLGVRATYGITQWNISEGSDDQSHDHNLLGVALFRYALNSPKKK